MAALEAAVREHRVRAQQLNGVADLGDEVHGLIVAHAAEDALQYAISLVPRLALKVYEVEFRLKDPPPLLARAR
ncbi:MAG: hypothetical protein HYZ28_04425 [Myxococcales bacterium]|nr:hypothetical protein [Myxococcales bacterium]